MAELNKSDAEVNGLVLTGEACICTRRGLALKTIGVSRVIMRHHKLRDVSLVLDIHGGVPVGGRGVPAPPTTELCLRAPVPPLAASSALSTAENPRYVAALLN